MPNLRAERLFRGELVAVTDVRCRGAGHGCGAEEQAGTHQVVFTRAGVFVKHAGTRRIFGEPNQAIFFNRDECYRVSHPAGMGDDCTVFTFSGGTIVQVLAACRLLRNQGLETPFHSSHARVDPGVIWRYQQLRRLLRRGTITQLEVEETALEILASLLWAACPEAGFRKHGASQVAVRRRRELAEAVQLALASQPGARQSLSGLARSVDCSPFHLTRVFREEVGIPVHRYLLRLRLAVAVERLINGERNLSALACDLGFASHSHLSSAFRRTFGATPSGFRCLNPASKNLTAPAVARIDVPIEDRTVPLAHSGCRQNVIGKRHDLHAVHLRAGPGCDCAANPAPGDSGRNPY